MPVIHTYVLPLFLLILASCSSPTTVPPTATTEEIAIEQRNQIQLVRTNPFPPIVEPVHRTKAMSYRLQAIALRIVPEMTKLCYELYGQGPNLPQCTARLELSGAKKGVNAYADGEKVVVTPAMMLFAKNDTHLAFVLAHEAAHHMMEHPRRAGTNATVGGLLGSMVDIAATSAGAGTGGAFGKMGAQASLLQYSPGFEKEADYIGLYILARAGYKIEDAPVFWRAMSQFSPNSVYVQTTHPTNPERYVVMQKTINEIRSKQKLGMALIPEFQQPS